MFFSVKEKIENSIFSIIRGISRSLKTFNIMKGSFSRAGGKVVHRGGSTKRFVVQFEREIFSWVDC